MDIHHYVNVHNTHMADGVAQFHGHRLSAFSLSCILTIITSSHNITQVIKKCVTNDAWSQAQLGLKFGGLGVRSLSHHAAATFIASLSFSGFGKADNIHLKQAVAMFNTQVSPFNTITVNSALESPIHQKVLSGLIQAQHFHILLESSSPANRACLLSVALLPCFLLAISGPFPCFGLAPGVE